MTSNVSQTLHDELIQTLVRDGYDQCQLAYRKLIRKKFYKSYRASVLDTNHTNDDVTPEVVPFIGRTMDDTREFTLDAINQAMEDILSKLRWYSKSLQSYLNDNDDDVDDASMMNRDEHSNDMSSHDGNGSDTTGMSFHQQLYECNTQTFPDLSAATKQHTALDMHPFASKKRRTKIIITGGDSSKGKKKAKKQRMTAVGNSTRNIAPTDAVPRQHERVGTRSIGSELNPNVDDDMVDIMYEHDFNPSGRRQKSRLNRHPHRSKKACLEIDEQQRIDDSISIDDANIQWQTDSENTIENDSLDIPHTATIPEIENILRPANHANTKRNRDIDAALPRKSKQDQRVSDRMRQWLQANDHDFSTLDNDGENDDPQQFESSKSRRRLRCREHQKGKRQGVSKEDRAPQSVTPTATIDETKVFLFSSLLDRRSKISSTTLPDCSRPSSLMSVCARIQSRPSNVVLQKTLDEVCAWFDDDNAYTPTDASLAFQTILDLLLNGGTTSLQDLVSSESPALHYFIGALVAIFGLFRRNVHHFLTPDDGVLFESFGKDSCNVFIDFCVMQFVDTVMSLFQPRAWALQIRDVRNVLRQIEPLRNELAMHMHLTERVCEQMLVKLPPQEWRCVREGENVFVSSINPDDWEVLLTNGVPPHKSTTARFEAFEKVLPRCEVDAIWCSLAYFASIETSVSSSDSNRWCLLSHVFFKGSLYIDENAAPIPPELEQVKAAIDDLKNMTFLLLSGVLGPLPRRDNFLIDVIKKALMLEADYIMSNDSSHEIRQPSTQRKQGLDSLALLREDLTFDSSMMATGNFNSFINELCTTNFSDMGTKQQFPLPSSHLLRCCLALLLVWKKQIPFDKAKRLQCFGNAVKSFAKQITKNCVGVDSQDRNNMMLVRDVFSDAFNSPTKETNCTDTATQRDSFLKECAAYMTIFVSASFDGEDDTRQSMHLNDDETDTSKLVWDFLSNDEMHLRQQWIVSSDVEIPLLPKCCKDASTLFVAANVMATVAIMLLGKDPSCCSVFTPMLLDGNTKITERFSAIRYSLSCLLTCIDVACDLDYKPEILSSVSINAAFILRVLVNASQHFNGIAPQIGIEMKALGHMILKANVIQRGFYKVLGASTSNLEDSPCFQHFVIFTHISMKLFCSERALELSLAPVEETQSSDTFDDIDDDVLANIDINQRGQRSMITKDYNEIAHSIYNMVINALEVSKPSTRTKIQSIDPGEFTITISRQGMKLVDKHYNLLCKFIADILCRIWSPTCPIEMPWNSMHRFRDTDDQDNAQYFNDISKAITSNICRRHDLVIVQDIVRGNIEPFIFNCLESIMNPKLLRKLPSCNLNRIGKDGATVEEERGFSELLDYRNGSLLGLNERLTEVRGFCDNLSRILLANHDVDGIPHFNTSVGKILDAFSSDTQSTKLVPSLEREIFHRFILIRCLISKTAMGECDINMFERLSAHLLLICSTGLLYALEKIIILDQALLNVKGHMYGRSKLFETVACLVELHVNVVTTIVWCRIKNPQGVSWNFDILVRYIRDEFVLTMLGGKDVTPLASIRSLVGYCTLFLKGQQPIASRMGRNATSNFDMKLYCDLYQNALVRRSRELVLSIDMNNIGSIASLLLSQLHATMDAGDNEAAMLGRAFTTSSFYGKSNYSQFINVVCRSPLQIAIDEYYAKMEESEPLSAPQMKNLHDLKEYAISAVVVPILAGEYKQPIYAVNKMCLFRFLQSILAACQEQVDRINTICDGRMFEVPLLCAIVKQIGLALRNEVLYTSKNTVNESLVELMFTCGRSVLSLPAKLVDPKSIGWFVDWACPSTTSTNTLHSNYIWYVCDWLRTLGDIILYRRTSELYNIRRSSAQAMPNTSASSSMELSIWIPLGDSGDHLERARYLNELEESVFARPVIAQPKYLKANKYVTGRTQQRTATSNNTNQSLVENEQPVDGRNRNIVFDEWVPSDTLRLAICQFNEKIQFATPSRDTLRHANELQGG